MRRGDPVAGTHNHGLWLWVPALRPLHGRRSGRRSFIRTRNQPAAVGNDRWFPSPVSGLLFTGNAATPTCRTVSASLLLGDAGALDHRRPFADVAGEAGFQLLGRAGLGFDPKLGVTLLHLGHR